MRLGLFVATTWGGLSVNDYTVELRELEAQTALEFLGNAMDFSNRALGLNQEVQRQIESAS
jgi:hypothetical protein